MVGRDKTARSTVAKAIVTALLWFTPDGSDEADSLFRFLLNLLWGELEDTDLPFSKSTGMQIES